ncbi:MAG: CDP-alcohol phosphatidyltransferase family protein [Burkholderiales bacterium]
MTLSIYQLKPRFQQLLQPLVSALAATRVTPNQLTLGTALAMLAYGVALACWPQQRGLWLGLVLVMPLRMAFNALDGLLAKHTRQQSRLGAVLNEVCDVAADLALALPFALLPGVSPVLAVLAAALATVAETTGLAALAAGGPRRFDGPMGKSDRAFAYGAMGLMAGLGLPALYVNVALGVVMALLVWTIGNRLRRAVQV